MGLDIYSGKLTRYYSRNWKTIVQQMSEGNGQKCVMTDGSGNEMKPVEDPSEIDQIRETVTRWIDNIATGIDQPLPSPLWDETSECAYYTDKPDWEAFGALVLLQACQSLNRPLPEYVENRWDALEDPIVKEAMSKKIVNSLLYNVDLWLPIPDNAIFIAAYPTGNEGSISTVSLLKKELEELNRQLWKADEATILSWRNDKYYVPVKTKEPKFILGFIRRTNKTPKEKYRTEDLAQCAYSMLYQAVRFAEEHRVPIVLDY
ncbi:hypothetical protein [Duncaniella muris]|jgi:hypothetical protein|uniref:hypothetical protein n=1 Tax=Duncaniella muris TaxID=2094150 RepID=UPI00136D3E70|nr:hypothetical protein [Duncaniella muris]NBH92325.1 hypothetical protein [Muribaculaceae bacterium S4]NBI20782.1 hypothetical protein [Muribaculaceae bacterium Z1]